MGQFRGGGHPPRGYISLYWRYASRGTRERQTRPMMVLRENIEVTELKTCTIKM